MVNRFGKTNLEVLFERTVLLMRTLLRDGYPPDEVLERFRIHGRVVHAFLNEMAFAPTVFETPPSTNLETELRRLMRNTEETLNETGTRPEIKVALISRYCADAGRFLREREQAITASLLAALPELMREAKNPRS